METRYILYSKIFASKYISSEIFRFVHDIQKDFNSYHYDDIEDVTWMVKQNHLGLLKEKLTNNRILSFNIKQEPYPFIITNLKDGELFIEIFKKFRSYFVLEDLFRLCVNFGSVDIVRSLDKHGYLNIDRPKGFYQSFKMDWLVCDTDIFQTLINGKFIDVCDIQELPFKLTSETLGIAIQNMSKPLDEANATNIWNTILNSWSLSIFKGIPTPIPESLKKVISETSFSTISSTRFNDFDLFSYVYENVPSLTLDQKREWFLENIYWCSEQSIGLEFLLFVIEKGMTFDVGHIDYLISMSITTSYRPLLDYILDVWQPEYQLNNIHMDTTKQVGRKDKTFFSMELVDKLLSRGLDLFLYYAICGVVQGKEDIFFKLWDKVSNRIDVKNNRIFLDSLEITEPLINRCVYTCNSTILNFLIEKGLTTDYQEYHELLRWIDFGDVPKNTYEFIVDIQQKTPYNSFFWEDLMTETFYSSKLNDNFFELAITIMLSQNDIDQYKKIDFIKSCITRRRFKRLKFLVDEKGFIITESNRFELDPLPRTSVECVEYLMKKFDFIEKQVKTETFVRNVINNDNYPLFKYIASIFKIDSLEPYYEALNQTNSESIRNLIKTTYSSILNPDKFIQKKREPVRIGL